MRRRPLDSKRAQPRPNLGAQHLRRWLADTGTTQRRLAETLRVSVVSVFKWLSGRAVPRLKMAIELRELCGIPVEAWWLAEEDDPGDGPIAATGTDEG